MGHFLASSMGCDEISANPNAVSSLMGGVYAVETLLPASSTWRKVQFGGIAAKSVFDLGGNAFAIVVYPKGSSPVDGHPVDDGRTPRLTSASVKDTIAAGSEPHTGSLQNAVFHRITGQARSR